MKYQIVVEMDSNVDPYALDENGDYVIGNDFVVDFKLIAPETANNQSPDGGPMMVGTRIQQSRKVVLFTIHTDALDPLAEITTLISANSLDWVVHALKSIYKVPVLDEDGDPVLDENGDPVLDENGDPVLGEDGAAVRDYIRDPALDPSFVDWLADVMVDEIPTRPVDLAGITRIVGIPSIAD